MPGNGKEACQMSKSGLKAIPNVREWSEGPPKYPGVVGGPPGCPGEVWRPSRLSWSGRVALPDVREWLGDPTKCPGVVGRPSQMSGSGR